jgi:autotransporter-associated beta strand protein
MSRSTSSTGSTRSRFLGVLFVLCLAAALWATPAFAANGTWNGIDGNWSDSGTWSGGTIADGTGFTAFFTVADIAADQTITLDTVRIIGNITFTDANTPSNNLTISGANTLFLDVTAGTPTIDVTQSGRTLTIGSVIGGSDGLTKSGAGTLILSGVNNYGGTTTIGAGELVATTGATFTPFGTGTVAIGANILTLSPSSTAEHSTLANTLTGTGTLNINPAAGKNMTLSGTLSGFTGTVNVAANTSPAKLVTGSVTFGAGAKVNIASGATWFMNGGTHSNITANIYGTGNGENLGALRMDGGTIDSTSSVVLKANGSVGASSGTGTISAVISDGSGGYSLTKMGAGAIALGAANTYTGATIISGGTLTLAHVDALKFTSGITIAGGATLATTLDGITISKSITLGTTGTTSTVAFSRASSAVGTLTLNGAIGGDGNLTFSTPNVNSGNYVQTIVLGAAGTYAGNTKITTATGYIGNTVTVKAAVANALPTTTVLTLDGGTGSGTSGRTVTFELNGNNQTLAGLTNVTGLSLRNQRVTNSGAPATLTVNNTNDYSYGGSVTTGSVTTTSTITGAIALTKQGAGTFTLAAVAANTYTGATKINAGALSINTVKNLGVSSAIGAPTTIANGLITLGSADTTGTLIYTGAVQSTDRTIQIGTNSATPADTDTGGATIEANGADNAALTFSAANFNTATNAAAGVGANRTLTLQGASTGANTISGIIRNNLASVGTGVLQNGIKPSFSLLNPNVK